MTGSPTPTPPTERRRNAALRELVEEMLASIRVAANRDLWTPDERQQYEGELAQIMARVRSEAMNKGEGGRGTASE
jgi:hypothetical protein